MREYEDARESEAINEVTYLEFPGMRAGTEKFLATHI